jgi:hypothetical protein
MVNLLIMGIFLIKLIFSIIPFLLISELYISSFYYHPNTHLYSFILIIIYPHIIITILLSYYHTSHSTFLYFNHSIFPIIKYYYP